MRPEPNAAAAARLDAADDLERIADREREREFDYSDTFSSPRHVADAADCKQPRADGIGGTVPPSHAVQVPSAHLCGFCRGRPVGNAASWVDGRPRPPAACPRCGETNENEPEAIHALPARTTP